MNEFRGEWLEWLQLIGRLALYNHDKHKSISKQTINEIPDCMWMLKTTSGFIPEHLKTATDHDFIHYAVAKSLANGISACICRCS